MQNFKSRIFATVSHDLRTPISLILSPTERLLRSTRLEPDQRQDLEMVARHARALLRYADELLECAKLEADAPAGVEVPTMVSVATKPNPNFRQAREELRAASGTEKGNWATQGSLVLVVEDDADMNRFITDMLASHYPVASAYDGREGMEKLRTLRPDLVISDIKMPEMNGEQFVHEIRRHAEWDQVPIVLLTANADETLRVKFLCEGVQDYLTKPFRADELLARVANLLSMKQRVERQVEEQTRDLAEANVELERLATTDVLTGIANRRRIMDLAAQALMYAQRNRYSLALLIFDIDHFKSVNDQHGHEAGDGALAAVAQAAAKLIRPCDSIGRMGGEEFLVLLPETTGEEAVRMAERLRSEIAALVIDDGGGHRISVTVSIGIAAIKATNRAENLRPLISRADTALYHAKSAGRNRISVAS